MKRMIGFKQFMSLVIVVFFNYRGHFSMQSANRQSGARAR